MDGARETSVQEGSEVRDGLTLAVPRNLRDMPATHRKQLAIERLGKLAKGASGLALTDIAAALRRIAKDLTKDR